jgi:two-component system, OmpR family, response regulator
VNAIACPCLLPGSDTRIPRFREAGYLTLDRLNCDGRAEDHWLGLHPREFALLWRLAEHPGQPVSSQQLLVDAWRVHFETQSAAIDAHMARLRSKLAPFALADMIVQHADGQWALDGGPPPR